MTTSKEEILHHLFKLACPNNRVTSHTTVPDIDISLLPQTAAENAAQIIDFIEQAETNNERLAKELLFYYEYINNAFETTSKVAYCKTIQQALPCLANEIARIVNSRFCFYLGPLVSELSQTTDQPEPVEFIVFGLAPKEDMAGAHDFFHRHEPILREMAEADTDTDYQVRLISFREKSSSDIQGKGDVLALRLASSDSEAPLGTLIMVRSSTQELFAAVDMNLAALLAKMGSAVLDNINYIQKLQKTYLQTVASFVLAMEAKDPYTSGHSTRVADMACQLGRYLGLDSNQLQLLEWAGLLHDIGKIGIREDVLTKPGRLTDEEYNHIKSHPVKSYNVLKPIDALADILPAVKHHHEHFDGSGYPDNLKADQIPFHARILQIADVWDALTSTRSYRGAMSAKQANEIIRQEAGTILDPDLAKSFLEMIH